MKSVFISYANEDRAAAKEAHDALEAGGIDCWIAPDDIPAGADWPAAIFAAVKQSAALVLIFSKSANVSEEVNRELLIARQHKVPIIPFFLEDITPDGASGYHLTNLQFIHAFRMTADEAYGSLQRSLEARGLVPRRLHRGGSEDVVAHRDLRLPASVLFTEDDWEAVLQSIDEGNAVPIIGPELLEVSIERQTVNLYTYLAERLADDLQVPRQAASGHAPLSNVVREFIANGGQLHQVYRLLKARFPDDAQVSVPEPLLQLARVQRLKLFVTTTFDAMMERALRDQRPDHDVRTLAFSPQRGDDLPASFESATGSIVYHIFGRLAVMPTYAVTEDDAHETMYALQSWRQPQTLLYELTNHQIMLLGTNLPESIARSFVRLLHGGRQLRLVRRAVIVADNRLLWDPGFRRYIEESTQGIRVYQDAAAPFIEEMYRRWTSRASVAEPPRI